MNYSPKYKEAILRRMLPPNNESITKIALPAVFVLVLRPEEQIVVVK